MNFVLTQNNNIVIGPREWNKYFFENALLDDCGITANLQVTNTEFLQISDIVAIYPATIVEPSVFNPKTQQYAGPFWTFSATTATGTYNAIDKPIDHVKGNLKGAIAAERYNIEVAGTKTTINGTEVTVDTSREGRNVFAQQFLLMGTADTVQWKFPEAWMTLSKDDLGIAVAAGVAHIKAAFAWEATKVAEIEGCSDLATLDAVVLKQV